MLTTGVINDIQRLGSAENIHEEWEMAETTGWVYVHAGHLTDAFRISDNTLLKYLWCMTLM